jgi:acyl-CoA synthetase (AMP-forming)/AMP-acid ligase II
MYEALRARARTFGDREAVVDDAVRWSWRDLWSRTEQVADHLASLGVRAGGRVAVLQRNRADYLAVYFAVARLGAVVAPISYWLRAREIDPLLADSDPSVIVADAEFVSMLADRGAAQGAVVTSCDVVPALSCIPLLQSRSLADGAEPAPNVGDGPFSIFYTGGTTGGVPKGAVHSQRQTLLNGLACVQALGFTADDSLLVYTPMFHVGGWDYPKSLLLAGGRIVIMQRFDEEAVLAAIERERITALLGMPAIFKMLTTTEGIERHDLSSLRLLFIGGSVATKELLDEAPRRMGIEPTEGFCHVYGQTEAGPLATVLAPRDALRKLGSVGRPVATSEIRIVDDAGTECAAGDPGEIVIRGADVMIGYWRRDDATSTAIVDGWLHTGDIGRLDDEGYLYVVGRKKDMIISAGENIYPTEIEEVLRTHPAVEDVAVIGVPHPVMEEEVLAVLQPRAGATIDTDALVAFVKERLAGYKVPRRFEVLDVLPRTDLDKVAKNELRTRFGSVFERTDG